MRRLAGVVLLHFCRLVDENDASRAELFKAFCSKESDNSVAKRARLEYRSGSVYALSAHSGVLAAPHWAAPQDETGALSSSSTSDSEEEDDDIALERVNTGFEIKMGAIQKVSLPPSPRLLDTKDEIVFRFAFLFVASAACRCEAGVLLWATLMRELEQQRRDAVLRRVAECLSKVDEVEDRGWILGWVRSRNEPLAHQLARAAGQEQLAGANVNSSVLSASTDGTDQISEPSVVDLTDETDFDLYASVIDLTMSSPEE